MATSHLRVVCESCKVSNECSKKNSSPLKVNNRVYYCYLLNGYGRVPLDESKLSEESKEKVRKFGPCLTIAQVPTVDESGRAEWVVEKVFSQPVLHGREKTSVILELHTKSI